MTNSCREYEKQRKHIFHFLQRNEDKVFYMKEMHLNYEGKQWKV